MKCPECSVQMVAFGAAHGDKRWYICLGPNPSSPRTRCGTTAVSG
jgi:ssDNA-binding Zn-finger/Zn-ribbon topoisomerase 1